MKTTENILREMIAQDPQFMLKAARELIQWETTSVLQDGVVRSLIAEIEREICPETGSGSIRIAESILKSEFVRLYLKAQDDTIGRVSISQERYLDILAAEEQLKDKDVHHVLVSREHYLAVLSELNEYCRRLGVSELAPVSPKPVEEVVASFAKYHVKAAPWPINIFSGSKNSCLNFINLHGGEAQDLCYIVDENGVKVDAADLEPKEDSQDSIIAALGALRGARQTLAPYDAVIEVIRVLASIDDYSDLLRERLDPKWDEMNV